MRVWPVRAPAFVAFWSVVSLAISMATALVPGLREDASDYAVELAGNDIRLWLYVLTAIFVAPAVETALLALPVVVLRRYHVRDHFLIALSAGALALIHWSYQSQGFAVFPAFLVFAYAYVSRSRAPFNDGYGLAMVLHMISNLIPAAGLLAYRYFPSL